jgi:hypothetical protein
MNDTSTLLVMLTSCCLAIASSAQVDQQPSSNPFNIKQPIPTEGMYGRSTTIGNVSSRFHRTNTETTTILRFPATFIPLGDHQTLPVIYPRSIEAAQSAPPAKADPFIREPFYPQLTSLILENEVPRNLQKRLESYRAQRDQAAAAVIEKIAQLKALPDEQTPAAWAAFEQQEAATWDQIEAERSAILERLQKGGLWARGVKLADFLDLVRLADADHKTAPLIDLGKLRHFTPGLSMNQRDLIGEFQVELTEPNHSDHEGHSILVSGNGDRIALPAKLTPEQTKALQVYAQTKAELKKEILQTLLPLVNGWVDFSRLKRTAAGLNEHQAPKFARMAQELEVLTLALSGTDNDSPHNTARLIGAESQIDLEAFAMLSGPQRRLLAYSNVTR